MKKDKIKGLVASVVIITMSFGLCGCGNKSTDNRIVVEMVQYKPEAVKAFEKMEEKFNETHDDIELTIESPNEAMTILKTRFYQGRSAGYHWNWWRCELFQFPGF